MAIRFSDPVNAIKHSDTGDILKLIAQPDMISFAGGLPAEESFPAEEIKKATELVLNGDAGKALQYGPSLGYEPLRGKHCEAHESNCKNTVYERQYFNHLRLPAGS